MMGIFLYWFLVCAALSSDDHAIYISVIEISPKESTSAKVLVKVFKDDLESAIYNHSESQLSFTSQSVDSTSVLALDAYFKNHITIQINDGKAKPLRYISSEVIDMTVWLEYEMDCPVQWSNIKVKADYFMELFPTQSNIINIRANDSFKLMKLTKKEESNTVKW